MKQRSLVGGGSLLIGVGLFALSCGMSMAQFGGGGGGRGGMRGPATGIQMLRIPAVQTELKMTPDEIGKIDAKQQEVRTGMQGLFQGGFGQMTPEERQQRTEKMADLNDKAAADILMQPSRSVSWNWNSSARGRWRSCGSPSGPSLR